jgi:spore coat polysaccharide biosynthesis protein SpsF (cytidylyltransferase family)
MTALRQSKARTVAMVIARMGSSRLPGKSMIDIAGRPLLAHMIDIARNIRNAADVAVLTSSLPIDDPIAQFARAHDVKVARGHPEFVLDRIHDALPVTGAEVIVYVGGDCPLLDPGIVDRGIAAFFERGCDYLNNYDPPTFPEGMDVNVVARGAVEAAFKHALAPSQRIHAFSYLTRHPDQYSVSNFENGIDLSHHHWSLDFPEDLAFVRAAYDRLWRPGKTIAMSEVLALIERDPEIAALDKTLQRGPVAHAFWNSPGIMRDMKADIAALAEMAQKGDDDLAARCRVEIAKIEQELARFEAQQPRTP